MRKAFEAIKKVVSGSPPFAEFEKELHGSAFYDLGISGLGLASLGQQFVGNYGPGDFQGNAFTLRSIIKKHKEEDGVEKIIFVDEQALLHITTSPCSDRYLIRLVLHGFIDDTISFAANSLLIDRDFKNPRVTTWNIDGEHQYDAQWSIEESRWTLQALHSALNYIRTAREIAPIHFILGYTGIFWSGRIASLLAEKDGAEC